MPQRPVAADDLESGDSRVIVETVTDEEDLLPSTADTVAGASDAVYMFPQAYKERTTPKANKGSNSGGDNDGDKNTTYRSYLTSYCVIS